MLPPEIVVGRRLAVASRWAAFIHTFASDASVEDVAPFRFVVAIGTVSAGEGGLDVRGFVELLRLDVDQAFVRWF